MVLSHGNPYAYCSHCLRTVSKKSSKSFVVQNWCVSLLMGTSKEDNLLYFTVDGVTKKDLGNNGKRKVTVNETEIALFTHDGKFYAIQEKCPHNGGPLHEAEIEELPDRSLCVKCPWHSWRFSLTTGKCVQPEKKDKTAAIYPVRVVGEKISIGFTHIAPAIFTTPPNF